MYDRMYGLTMMEPAAVDSSYCLVCSTYAPLARYFLELSSESRNQYHILQERLEKRLTGTAGEERAYCTINKFFEVYMTAQKLKKKNRAYYSGKFSHLTW